MIKSVKICMCVNDILPLIYDELCFFHDMTDKNGTCTFIPPFLFSV